MSSRVLPLLLAVLAFVPGLSATTIVPPTFPELVAEADAIYRGRVTAVQARRVADRNGRSLIKTFVTIAIDRVLKGPAQGEVTLEFLGGTLGNETLEVVGMPKFTLGQREFLFVRKNGVQFCPLVALSHGRYRILHDDGLARDYVARDNGAPLIDPAAVGLPMTPLRGPADQARAASATAAALTPAAFEASVAAELGRTTAPANRN